MFIIYISEVLSCTRTYCLTKIKGGHHGHGEGHPGGHGQGPQGPGHHGGPGHEGGHLGSMFMVGMVVEEDMDMNMNNMVMVVDITHIR